MKEKSTDLVALLSVKFAFNGSYSYRQPKMPSATIFPSVKYTATTINNLALKNCAITTAVWYMYRL